MKHSSLIKLFTGNLRHIQIGNYFERLISRIAIWIARIAKICKFSFFCSLKMEEQLMRVAYISVHTIRIFCKQRGAGALRM